MNIQDYLITNIIGLLNIEDFLEKGFLIKQLYNLVQIGFFSGTKRDS